MTAVTRLLGVLAKSIGEMVEVDEDAAEKASRRQRHVDETTEILKRIAEATPDDFETIAELHELHARHEREVGHEANARRADVRAAKARARMANP